MRRISFFAFRVRPFRTFLLLILSRLVPALFFFFALFCFFIFLPGAVHADTVVPTQLSATTTWTAAHSPYIVSSGLMIPAGTTLSIGPGVTIKVSGEITVFGTLSAAGSAKQPTIFTSSDDKTRNTWGLAVSGGQLLFSNAVFRHSGSGIYLGSASTTIASSQISDSVSILASDGTLNIQNSDFENMASVLSAFNQSVVTISSTTINHISQNTAVAIYNSASATLSDVSMTDIGAVALAVYNQSHLTCNNCSIQESTTSPGSDSIAAYTGSTLALNDSTVLSSGANAALALYDTTGVSSSTAFISNSVFNGGSGNGIAAYGGVTLVLASTTIKNFSGNGIFAYNGASLAITSSDIEANNDGLNIFNEVSGFVASSTIKKNTSFGIESRTAMPFNARDNWWGDPTGPENSSTNLSGKGNPVSDDVDFIPWLNDSIPSGAIAPSTPGSSEPKCCSSIAFLPGMEASRLYELTASLPGSMLGSAPGVMAGSMPGTPSETRYWEPGLTTDTNVLDLNPDGTSIKKDIYTRDIIDGGSVLLGQFPYDVYQGLENHLTGLVTKGTIAAWQALPYDWRFAADIIASQPVALASKQSYSLISAIEQLAKSSKTGKVTLIAHSYGGLVAKELINLLAAKKESNLIDKLIFAATPALGTPEAIAAMLHGDDQAIGDGIILEAETARNLAKNMAMAYDLLPSPEYLSLAGGPVISFDPTVDVVSNFRKIYGDSINSVSQLYSFLTGSDGRKQPQSADLADPAVLSAGLINSATTLHGGLDSWIAPAGISVYQIAGVGLQTLKGLLYTSIQSCLSGQLGLGQLVCNSPQLDHQPIETDQGDGTVVVQSATEYPKAETFYFDLDKYDAGTGLNTSHQSILEASESQNLIDSIIRGSENSFASAYISRTLPASNPIITIGVHSPVSLSVEDASGRYTGLAPNQPTSSDLVLVHNGIPNSKYFEFGEGKYVVVPAAGSYKVGVVGTNIAGQKSGTFTLTIDQSVNGVTLASTTFSRVPVSSSTIARMNIVNGSTTPILLDRNGDGIVDATIAPDRAGLTTSTQISTSSPGFPVSTSTSSKKRGSMNWPPDIFQPFRHPFRFIDDCWQTAGRAFNFVVKLLDKKP
jgi:pimeloyl-ACP methyl ester carboxylesterase